MTEATVTYVKADGAPYSESDVAAIDSFRAKLLDGRLFSIRAGAAASNRFSGYRPPMNRAAWSHYVSTIGRMAGESDSLAQIARDVVGVVNLYGTNADALYQASNALAKAFAEPYTDVIGMAAPDAGRRSAHVHDWSLRTRILALIWMNEATAKFESSVPGVGWCLDALARAEHVTLSQRQFPSLIRGEVKA